MSPGSMDPHMAAAAVTEAEHPTTHDHDAEPPRSWGWTQIIVLFVVLAVLVACVYSLYSTIDPQPAASRLVPGIAERTGAMLTAGVGVGRGGR